MGSWPPWNISFHYHFLWQSSTTFLVSFIPLTYQYFQWLQNPMSCNFQVTTSCCQADCPACQEVFLYCRESTSRQVNFPGLPLWPLTETAAQRFNALPSAVRVITAKVIFVMFLTHHLWRKNSPLRFQFQSLHCWAYWLQPPLSKQLHPWRAALPFLMKNVTDTALDANILSNFLIPKFCSLFKKSHPCSWVPTAPATAPNITPQIHQPRRCKTQAEAQVFAVPLFFLIASSASLQFLVLETSHHSSSSQRSPHPDSQRKYPASPLPAWDFFVLKMAFQPNLTQ